MIEARWNGSVIARSDDTVIVESNHYKVAAPHLQRLKHRTATLELRSGAVTGIFCAGGSPGSMARFARSVPQIEYHCSARLTAMLEPIRGGCVPRHHRPQ